MPLKALTYGTVEDAAGGVKRQPHRLLQQGIPIEKAREIVRLIKDTKIRVQVSIQEDQVRVSGKNRDDLQKIIALLKERDLGIGAAVRELPQRLTVMPCPQCRHETPPDAKFCPECGARLSLACPACGADNAPGSKFCKACGQALARPAAAPASPAPQTYTPTHLAERILHARPSLEGERKQVTVLFADLKGSMELLADRDPEEARSLLDPVLERMMEAVHHYEGTVNQVMGDGIMALFGAPLAHEDHAVRACYAALSMQEAIRRYTVELRRTHGLEVQIRVG